MAKPQPVRNRILAGLPARDRERLLSKLERVRLAARAKLHEKDQPLDAAYFPENGVLSLVSDLTEKRQTVEVATVGNEGVLGLPLFLGSESVPLRAFSQIPGEHFRISAAEFRRELDRLGALQAALNRYVQAFLTQLAQSVACNRIHSLEQRCARWILQSHDRVGRDQFLLTQEFFAQMLGVRRASVNAVATRFKRQGLIDYRRGELTILSRPRLERVVCECYFILRREELRMVPGRKRAGGGG